MDGFVWSGLCICLLLIMVLRLLCWLLIVCFSFARLPVGWFGLVVSLLLVLVPYLAFWMGPLVVTPLFCVVWFRFRFFRRFLALWPSQVGRAYRLLGMVCEGCPGHGPIHLLVASAAEIGFQWDPDALAWFRPGSPLLSNLAGSVQHLKDAILDAWRNKVAADLCGRKGFRGGPLLDIRSLILLMFVKEIRRCFVTSWLGVSGMVCFLDVQGSLQLLNSSHVRDRDKGLLRSILVGGVWNDFLLGMFLLMLLILVGGLFLSLVL